MGIALEERLNAVAEYAKELNKTRPAHYEGEEMGWNTL